MLIEFAYSARIFGSYHNASSINGLDLKDVFTQWGDRHSSSEDLTFQLIDIDNSLIFGLVTSGLPEKCILYYDVLGQKMYFVNNINNLYNLKSKGYGSYAKSIGSTTMNHPSDAFDWGDDHRDRSPFFGMEVPPECFDDFYEVIKPYYEYDFKKQLLKLCENSFNFIHVDNEYPVSPMDDDSSYTQSKSKKYYMNCSSWFWELLIHDMYNGELYNTFKEKYPRTVDGLAITLMRVQNWHSTYGNLNYDPIINPE